MLTFRPSHLLSIRPSSTADYARPPDTARDQQWGPDEYRAAVLGTEAAARTGHRVAFNSTTGWITRLHTAHATGRPEAELVKIVRIPLIIVDELGYVPIEAEAANLSFQLVSTRYEKAWLIITSNLPSAGWGEVYGDTAIAAAMIDRIVHHAEISTTQGTSYRIRHTNIETLPSVTGTGPADWNNPARRSLFARTNCSNVERSRQDS